MDWEEFTGAADVYAYSEPIVVHCRCGDTVTILGSDEETCPTCGAEYKGEISAIVYQRGQGNGEKKQTASRAPTYTSLFMVRSE